VGEPSPTKRVSASWVALLFAFGCALEYGFFRIQGVLSAVVYRLFWETGVDLFFALNAQGLIQRLHSALGLVLAVASPIALVAVMGRPLWERRKLRRPGPGWLTSYARAHPVGVGQVLPWGAALVWMIAEPALELAHAMYVSFDTGQPAPVFLHALHRVGQHYTSPGFLLGSVVGLLGVAAAVRSGVRLLAREDTETPAQPADGLESDDKASFAAVAVTPSTQGAVAGLAALSIVAIVCAATLRSNGVLASMMLAYVLAAMGSAALFRRVSRIAVGIDGVLILGADKARFFSYAHLDSAIARGSDVLLKRHGKTALRLQLHEADVARAPELAARIERARLRAVQMQREGADQLMQATAPGIGASQRLASSARGGLDYRQPAMAREQLWQLVEGPVSSAGARKIAAEALAHDFGEGERERMRVAAERCAEPRAQGALVRVLGELEDEELDESGEEKLEALPLRTRALG
jgi:hypothetical protein